MENCFRVLLDFCGLNCKSLKYVWMNISPRELKTIKDFKNLILQKFSFQKNDLQLYLNEGLLLEDESILILRENDTVRLQYIEPPSLDLNNSSILNTYTPKESNSEISQKDNGNEIRFSKKLKRKHISSDMITMDSNKQKESCKKKKHKLSPETSIAKNNTAVSPFLIQPVNNYAEIENVSFVVPCNVKGKECKSREKKRKSKNFNDKSAFKGNPCIASENEVILSEKIIKIPEEDKMSLHCTEQKEKTKTEEQEYMVVSDCCKIIKETCSSSELYNNSFPNCYKKDFTEENQNQIEFENQVENNKFGDLNTDCVTNNSQLIQGSNCKKKKRKRHRKRKTVLNSSFDSDLIDESHIDFTSKYEDTESSNMLNLAKENDMYKNVMENSFKCSPTTKTSENKLSEANNIVSDHSICPSTTTTLQRCTSQKSNNISNPNKVSGILEENLNLGSHQSDYSFKSTISSNSSKTVPSTFNKQKKEEVYSSEDCSASQDISESNCKTINPTTKNNTGLSNSHKRNLYPPLYSYKDVRNWNSKFITSDCPPINSFPDAGIAIAFKILELDASYSPVISKYREGVVTAVNPQTDELEIELFRPEVKQGKTGKFENLYLDELPSCDVIKKMTLQWSTLIDPVQLCSPS